MRCTGRTFYAVRIDAYFAGGLKELIARKKVNKKKSPRWVRNGLPTRLTTTRRLIHDKVSS